MSNATKTQVEAVRTEAAANLAIAKAAIDGQFNVVNTRIDGLQKTIDGTNAGINELLRRSEPRVEPAEQPATRKAAATPAPLLPAPPGLRKPAVREPVSTGIPPWITH